MNEFALFLTPFIYFSEFIEKLFDDSQEQFHGIFKKTYGPLYEKNARIFRDYFGALRKYFYHGRVNLNEATKSFFATLYQKMFQVMIWFSFFFYTLS